MRLLKKITNEKANKIVSETLIVFSDEIISALKSLTFLINFQSRKFLFNCLLDFACVEVL